MGRSIRHPRPEYVLNFEKPPHTEIKFISGHWYLYEVRSKRADSDSRSKKTSGSILGSITPNGFVESKTRARKRAEQAQEASDRKINEGVPENIQEVTLQHAAQIKLASDTLEVGATTYFYERTQGIRLRLKKYFPDIWQVIYVIYLLILIFEPKLKDLKLIINIAFCQKFFHI